MDFIEWCKELNKVSVKHNFIPDLVEEMGEDAWYNTWKDGFSPEEAFQEICKEI